MPEFVGIQAFFYLKSRSVNSFVENGVRITGEKYMNINSDKIDKNSKTYSASLTQEERSALISKYRAVYRFLDKVSPIDDDCGKLCGAACCMDGGCGSSKCDNTGNAGTDFSDFSEKPDEQMGIYMLPGEELIHDMSDGWLTWSIENTDELDLPESWGEETYFVKCSGPKNCRRNMRPIQCRTFPLTPYINEEGQLEMLYSDMELPYSCPLIDEEIPLNDSFVRATRTAWKHLLRYRPVRDLVERDSEDMRSAYDTDDYMD